MESPTHLQLKYLTIQSSKSNLLHNDALCSFLPTHRPLSPRGSVSLAQYSPTENDECTPALVLTRMERLPQKDFYTEVRASLDVETFIKEATFLLDLDATDLDSFLDLMLHAIFADPNKLPNESTTTTNTTKPGHTNDDDCNELDFPNPNPSTDGATATQHVNLPNHGMTEKSRETEVDLERLITEAKKSLLFEVCYEDHKYQRLAKTIKGLSMIGDERLSTDQSWICAMCSLNQIHKRHLALARFSSPVNLGRSCEGTCLIALVITPTKEKGTKSDIEVGRTLATILSNPEFRSALMYATDESEVKSLLWLQAQQLSAEQSKSRRCSTNFAYGSQTMRSSKFSSKFGGGLYEDLKRRVPHYLSDIKEGIYGKHTLRKSVSTTFFLYFACLLPSIAFGMLNANNTHGHIAVTHMIIAQTIAGLSYGVFGGQPLIVLLSTAPLTIYIKIIYTITMVYGINFPAMYGCIGLFNSMLLLIYSFAGFSRWMRWSTRSTEEIFALFVSVAFIVDAAKDCHKIFTKYYVCPAGSIAQDFIMNPSENQRANFTSENFDVVQNDSSISPAFNNHTTNSMTAICAREIALLYVLLLFGTVLVALSLFNVTKTPFLTTCKRELLTDFALPISVLSMTMVRFLIFKDIQLNPFAVGSTDFQLTLVPLHLLDWRMTLSALGLAIPLSVLFFMEQNITSAIINSPANRLRKGPANHWDMLVVSMINMVLSTFTLPWVHAALPYSPLHVRALADMEERMEIGQHIRQTIVRVRETRLTAIFSHILIGCSLLMIPFPLSHIPPAVLSGLFVYMAITAVYDNQLFQRILLIFTEQSAYPPSHYIRRVPQRKIHLFTLTQLIQLAVLCLVAFAQSPYVEMSFPLLLIGQILIRHLIIPKIIQRKYLDALDRSI